jgi:hypothetical protein
VVACELPLLRETGKIEELIGESQHLTVSEIAAVIVIGHQWSRRWWKVSDTEKFVPTVSLACWWKSTDMSKKEIYSQLVEQYAVECSDFVHSIMVGDEK